MFTDIPDCDGYGEEGGGLLRVVYTCILMWSGEQQVDQCYSKNLWIVISHMLDCENICLACTACVVSGGFTFCIYFIF